METTVNERIKILIDALENGVSSRFAKKIGVSSSVVANYLPGGEREGEPSSSVLRKMISAYEKINIEWVLTGKGEMFKNSGTTPAVSTPGTLHKNVSSSNNNIRVGTGATPPETGTDIDYYRQRIRELEQKNTELLNLLMQTLTKKE